MSNEMTVRYNTELFCEVFEKAEDFVTAYKANGFYTTDSANRISDSEATLTYYLLYSQYGNSPIANYDVEQFKYKLWSTMFKYGPAWSKKLSIQGALRQMDENAMRQGAQQINAQAFAMGDAHITANSDPTKIDQKSGTYYTKSKLDGYSNLLALLETDVTTEYINKFKKCFKQFVMPENPLLYVTDLQED